MRDTGVPAFVAGLFTESLLAVEWDGRIVPRICEGWEWLPDGAGIRLKLRPNVVFHDGTPLTADLLAETIRREIATQSALSFESVTRVEATAADIIEIHLRRPDGFLPADISDFRVRLGANDNVGTGAFMRVPNDESTLVAFDRYYQGPPAIKRINVHGYQTLRSAWSALMRDEINMLYEVSPDAVDFVDQESSVTTHPFTRPYYYFVPFNMRHPILRRREVRQALSQAVDRQAIVRDAMRDRGEPADGPIWKYHWAYSTAQRTHQHNAEAARLRLEAAGLTGGKTAAGQMPSRFRFTCLMFGEDPRFERIALVLQKQLYDVGVDMHIEALPYLELAKRMQRGDFDALLIEITSGRSLSWVYRVWHSAHKDSVLNTGYQAADRALERVRVARTESETRAAVSEVQRVLYEDPPALFLAWPHVSRAVSSSIEVPTYDSPAKPGSDIVGRLWQFRPAAPGVARR